MKKMMVTGIVAAGLLIGGASIVGASMNDDDDVMVKEEVKSEEVVNVKGAKTTENMLPIEKIKGIALSEYEGHIEDIDLEHDNGYAYYEVDIENGEADYEIYIDAYTGEVLTVGIDDDDREKQHQAIEDIMSADEAKKIAVDHVGGKVVEIELDEDDNHFEYEMELRTDLGEVELTIDAVTGEILEQELED